MKLMVGDVEAKKGMSVTTFRGEKGILTDWTEPKTEASTGRVYIKIKGHQDACYPSVIGAKFV